MVCVCCDPCRSLCPGVGLPGSLLFTISEAVFEDGGGYWFDESDLTFALTDSFVLTRGSLCLGYFASLYPQPAGLYCNPPGVFPFPHKLGIGVTFGTNSTGTAFSSLSVSVSFQDTEATIKRAGCFRTGQNTPLPIQTCAIEFIVKTTTGIDFCAAASQGHSDTMVNPNPVGQCFPLRSISYSFEPA